MSQELKPCPGCGSTDQDIYESTSGSGTKYESARYYHQCICGFSTETFRTKEEVYECWNCRVQSDLAKVSAEWQALHVKQQEEINRLTAEVKRYREALEEITKAHHQHRPTSPLIICPACIAEEALREGKGVKG